MLLSGSSQHPMDLLEISQANRQTKTQLRWRGFLCLSGFPIPLSPLTTYTVTVRKFSLLSDLHPFCFCASFLLLGGNVLWWKEWGLWGHLDLGSVASTYRVTLGELVHL